MRKPVRINARVGLGKRHASQVRFFSVRREKHLENYNQRSGAAPRGTGMAEICPEHPELRALNSQSPNHTSTGSRKPRFYTSKNRRAEVPGY